jgi:hypothetical protein
VGVASPEIEAPARTHLSERRLLWREATTMVLYLSIVLLAQFAALPTGDDPDEPVHGPVGWELVAIVWGTTIGLVLAHTIAFRIATHGLSGGRLLRADRMELLVELAGAAFVATLTSIPVLVFGDSTEQQAIPFVLVLIIGGTGYLVERENGRSRTAAVIFGTIALVIALAVAVVKNALAYH